MKKTTFVITSTLASVVFAACATTQEIKETEAIIQPVEISEPRQIIVQESPEDIFIKSLEGITISKVSSPKEVYKGRKFAEPFVFEAKNGE